MHCQLSFVGSGIIWSLHFLEYKTHAKYAHIGGHSIPDDNCKKISRLPFM
jgi:hypothetical protein